MKNPGLLVLALLVLLSARCVSAQTENATITGRVADTTKAVIVGAQVTAINTGTNLRYEGITNNAGSYLIEALPPGSYRIEVGKTGFKTIVETGTVLHVQDTLELNFEMAIGSVTESVTVNASGVNMNTTDGSVSTVVDRNFAENLPLNGRSFQSLVQLTPGVVVLPSNGNDSGQFSVNGQRAASNYWMVDGVSANVGVPAVFTQGNGISGAAPGFSVQGGTNGLVSVDAMQEFRIETSTYSPEFGRVPGAQISIATRSGTNQFHGTVFEYLRNDALDANDWFADRDGLPKAQERQNDFGGTLGGPILKNRTFFFFSYEGLRLRLPQTLETNVPDVAARQAANAAVQPFLNAFPLPTPGASDDPMRGVAQFNSSFSNKSTLDAYSLRFDHRIKDKLNIFGRYSYSPSELAQRGSIGTPSQLVTSRITSNSITVGSTWLAGSTAVNDVHFNYSRTHGQSQSVSDNFGGAVPLSPSPLPEPFTDRDSSFIYQIFSLQSGLDIGLIGENIQRQINITDSLSISKGAHVLKLGLDYRRLSPSFEFPQYIQQVIFSTVPAAASGSTLIHITSSDRPGALLFHNIGLFAQDTWHVVPRLTLTYGLRWDLDVAPSSTNGVTLPALTDFSINNLSSVALAAPGTSPFGTSYKNFAPRVGAAYQMTSSPRWQTVLRGGFGVFYDLVTTEVGNSLHEGGYPFGAISFGFGGNFPLDSASAAPPPISEAQLASGLLFAFDPQLKSPYSLQWSTSLEQGLGTDQTLSLSYIGSRGRRLLQTAFINNPNPNFGSLQVTTNAATSDYDALQMQFHRRMSAGLQALASYTWAHSIDTASAGSVFGNEANALVGGTDPKANRGPSDFDVRQAFSAGLSYTLPGPKWSRVAHAMLQGWSLQSTIQARSAPPEDLFDSSLFFQGDQAFTASVRPDLVSGQPLYLFGNQYPGGKAFNAAAFVDPPTDPNTGAPLRQGTLPRNAVRTFGAAQWDFAVHRDFPVHESWRLQFRAEMFNFLNHPNFGAPVGDLSNTTQFGQSIQTLGRNLENGNQGGGSLSSLYQIGGPRSIQLALKLLF
ncbi:MAG TPA: TonB-dependent receptor [Candidatus Acidoferrum sp.]|nr:TonB-dependent receptor [Candidatus Acidoferrum sp.]